jgi:Arc/MetJ family transcription regulator
MRTTLNIAEDLLEEAQRACGLETRTAVIEAGLRALIEQAARERLSRLAGTVREAQAPCRRRPPGRR